MHMTMSIVSSRIDLFMVVLISLDNIGMGLFGHSEHEYLRLMDIRFFQRGTNWADGPAFVNQCPISPGQSRVFA